MHLVTHIEAHGLQPDTLMLSYLDIELRCIIQAVLATLGLPSSMSISAPIARSNERAWVYARRWLRVHWGAERVRYLISCSGDSTLVGRRSKSACVLVALCQGCVVLVGRQRALTALGDCANRKLALRSRWHTAGYDPCKGR